MSDTTTLIPPPSGESDPTPVVPIESTPRKVSTSRLGFLAPAVLFVLIMLAFMPVLDAGLVDWDDDDLLIHETRYRTISYQSLQWMFTTSYTGHFQPLTWLSYSLDWSLWGRGTTGPHAFNVLLHFATAWLLYLITRRLLLLGLRRTADAPASSTGKSIAHTPAVNRVVDSASMPILAASFLAAVFFAVHPLRVESVAWLAERRDVLSGVLYVGAVAAYLRYADNTPDRSTRSIALPFARKYYGLSVFLCFISLLAKASAVTLPLVLIILDVYPLRRWKWGRHFSWKIVAEKIPFLLLALLGGVRAVIAQQESGAMQTVGQHDLFARFAQSLYGLVFYLWKTILPAKLSPLYEIPSPDILTGSMLWISGLVWLALILLAIKVRRRAPAVPIALMVYLVVVFPVLGFLQSGPQLVADRYSYLSCMGFAVLIGAGFYKLFNHPLWCKRANVRAVGILVGVVFITQSVRATFRQSDYWYSAKTLWSYAVQVSPGSAIAHTNYADALMGLGEVPLAFHHYQTALELYPNDAVALHRVADIYNHAGQRDKAVRFYLRSLRLDPNRRRACVSLAGLLAQTPRASDAVRILQDGLTRHPDDIEMMIQLADMRATHPDPLIRDGQEAVRLALRVNQINRNANTMALMTLASAYGEAGRFDDAVQTMQKALSLLPSPQALRFEHEMRSRLELFKNSKPYRREP